MIKVLVQVDSTKTTVLLVTRIQKPWGRLPHADFLVTVILAWVITFRILAGLRRQLQSTYYQPTAHVQHKPYTKNINLYISFLWLVIQLLYTTTKIKQDLMRQEDRGWYVGPRQWRGNHLEAEQSHKNQLTGRDSSG